MDFPWTEILGGIGGGLAALIVAALFLGKTATEKIAEGATKLVESRLRRLEERDKSAFALASAVDIDLRTRRINAYVELWEKTGLVPQWPRNSALEYRDLQKFSLDLREWYFKGGGLFLSTSARKQYTEVQEALQVIVTVCPSGLVADLHYDAIRQKCSTLRTELTKDIHSRRDAPEMPSSEPQ